MELVNGKVVTTTETDLKRYLEMKEMELDMLGKQIANLTAIRDKMLLEMEGLATKKEGESIVDTLKALIPKQEEVK